VHRGGSQHGQGTVEWVGLVALVVAMVAAAGAAGVRIPGTGLAESIVHKVECAFGEDAACGKGAAEPALVRAYGRRLADEVRAHAPEVDYEAGMTALPVDFRSCRGPVCGNGPSTGAVWLSDTGAPAASFVHVVDCRAGEPHRVAIRGACTAGRRGNLYLQYWLFYEDSTSLRDLPGDIGFHEDDWESYQVRIAADGACESRASSHNSYSYDGGIGSWLSDAGIFPRSAWGACTGRTFVSGGSHAGHVHEDGDPGRPGGRRYGDAPLPVDGGKPSRWTPALHLKLIPIESLGRRARRAEFAIAAPWKKLVYLDPEWRST
jgi:hypothetical protein